MSINHLLNPVLTSTPTYLEMSQQFDFTNHSHRRLNLLTNRYVLCSPHRAKRPWQGAKEEIKKTQLPEYDPKCYLCPGNVRATGDVNPKYETTYIFPNDYPAMKIDQPDYKQPKGKDLKSKLFVTQAVKGKCFVICFSSKHNLTLPLMNKEGLISVVNAWQTLYNNLNEEQSKGDAPFKYLQIFENKGFAMGCSNPHPHGQAWCLDTIPTEVNEELTNMEKYHEENSSHLLGDYVKLELQEKERIVAENDSFLIVVPYWALWPFETLVISKEHLHSIAEFNDTQKQDLASILKILTTKYDNLFNTSFPYSMGIHQAPFTCTKEQHDCSWFHMHFYPPLLRSATVKKFCVGFEMLGEAQRDLTSEQAAARLNELSGEVHYMNQ
ncbi:unnamed protein product [Candida verbasci]|uniref:Galactose-1-phosphate uridylyltransferase n=1 Tax=Candida verbasci TaxID=1227364 RepID=A0A9W4XB10_9ASCO|nr:unnamed protein product [Candida verbasci]